MNEEKLKQAKAWREGLQPPERETAEERIAIKIEAAAITEREAVIQTFEELSK